MTEITAATQNAQQTTAAFHTALGWMALALNESVIQELIIGHSTNESVIQKLVIGHSTAGPALAALSLGVAAREETRPGWPCHLDTDTKIRTGPGNTASDGTCVDRLIERLQAYANGRRVDFDDFKIDTRRLSDFGRRVTTECRKIPYGKTLTYGELAARAGSPAAARAVGNRMAANRVPIIVPCHRVLPSGEGLGGFSASGGVEMKRRLLEMESRV